MDTTVTHKPDTSASKKPLPMMIEVGCLIAAAMFTGGRLGADETMRVARYFEDHHFRNRG